LKISQISHWSIHKTLDGRIWLEFFRNCIKSVSNCLPNHTCSFRCMLFGRNWSRNHFVFVKFHFQGAKSLQQASLSNDYKNALFALKVI
jgi:hypothetical protein